MIYTITLNPALDRTIWVQTLQSDDANRVLKEEKFAGGKGIDVSRVLTHLGVPNRALGFLGGYAGMEVEGMLLQEGVYCDFTSIANETRTNIVVNVEADGRQILFSARGPEVNPAELTAFFHKLENLHEPQFVSISGSLPPNLSPVLYARSIETLRARGAQVLLDTDGENLRMGITGRPNLIKPNIHELSRLTGKKLSRLPEIVSAAREIQRAGVEMVLVSMGARGILLVSEQETLLAIPPQVKVVNTIGAGDSAVAGFLFGLSKNSPPADCLKYAVAAGTATTLQPGTALARREDIQKLLPGVTLKNV